MPNAKKLRIYLASQSPRRKEILTQLKIPFKTVSSRYQERALFRKTPRHVALAHAIGKAKKAVLPGGARYVLGADTIVVYGRRVLGKPKNAKDAGRILGMLSGRTHYVMTAVVLYDVILKKMVKGVEKTKVIMKKWGHEKIESYIKTVRPFDKAGSYGIQDSPKIVAKISGSYSNVVGLPTRLVRALYREITL